MGAVDVSFDPAEVDGNGFMPQGSGRTLQVLHVPATFGAKNADSHDQLDLEASKERAFEDFRSDSAKRLASSGFQVMKNNLGGAEKHGIDLVEIMVIAFEDD